MTVKIGVVGYSGQKFDEEVARGLLSQAFDEVEKLHPNEEKMVYSGLTDLGVPALAYREAAERGWKTVGVACSKAENYECFPVDEKTIVGDQWGDESSTFLESIDILIRIGGGKQSFRETAEFKENGGPVIEHELQAE